MPAVTARYINCTSVGFTPTSGSLGSLTGITSVTVSKNATNVAFSGDNDRFSTFRANVMQDPSVSFQGGNVVALFALVAGVYGTVVWTICDAKNGTGSGSATFTLINAMVDDSQFSGQHAQFMGGSLTFQSYSSDGSTNPLSYVFN